MELLQLCRIRGEPRGGAWSLRVGIASRIDEGSRHAVSLLLAYHDLIPSKGA